jgi:hypothetical protein
MIEFELKQPKVDLDMKVRHNMTYVTIGLNKGVPVNGGLVSGGVATVVTEEV